ncbi:MAG: DNA-binding NarL/FixJ family response regulator [Saprospiraceae bacterium]|jgi:DNA-binding NarL/FixJ family response regulator
MKTLPYENVVAAKFCCHYLAHSIMHELMEYIKVGIVEDDTIIRSSLVQCLDMYPSMECAFAVDSVEASLEYVSEYGTQVPDVIILDIGLPGLTGLQDIRPLRDRVPESDIIMLTTYDDGEIIFEALCNGACSYISKKRPLKTIMEAVTTIYRGNHICRHLLLEKW